MAGQISIEMTGWQTKQNDVRKPNAEGSTFSYRELLGSGTALAPRLDFSFAITDKQELRLLLAPFQVKGDGQFQSAVRFKDSTFQAHTPTEGLYRFNSWRLTWRRTLLETSNGKLSGGFTAKVRDARISLRQGALREVDSNVGFVPLLHLLAEYRVNPAWKTVLEVDGLGASQGRAIDGALMLRYQGRGRWFGDVGYRVLEGGADNDKLYTWALLHGVRAGVGMIF